MSNVKTLPPRSDIAAGDTWDLGSLYTSEEAWEEDFKKFEAEIAGYDNYRGKLGESAATLKACLDFDYGLDRLGERLGVYAFLRTTEDQADSDAQRRVGRFQHAATNAAQAGSFIRPELLAIDKEKLDGFLADPELELYRLAVEQLVRYRPHTLTGAEENLLAMQGEMAGAASKAFRQLLDADLKFGSVVDENGDEVELGNSTFSKFLQSPDRSVRETAFRQYYEQFTAHENTLAAMLSGSVAKDIYYAKARNHDSALSAALFPDNAPQAVYDNLIAAVRKNLPAVHRYLDVRRRKMKLDDIHQYDTYVPILSDVKTDYPWDKAVSTVIDSLQPLGSEYCQTLEKGLSGRWADRYPNKGKQSGAFSCGTFDGDPYILMNYKPDVLNDLFTLTHEAGHSMHSFYSAGNQPFPYYNYTIFVAEVASTFNEQLLSHHLLSQAEDDKQRAYLINTEIDDIRGTIVRQTMFAEFEKIMHEMAEAGEPLTVQALKETYRKLLQDYFGPEFVIDEELSLECLRIPHFYRAFYVYKYATGMSAAIALSQRVLGGGEAELNDYLNFLKGGCSQYPLDLLRGAGVDLEKPEPVDTALAHFDKLVTELDELL